MTPTEAARYLLRLDRHMWMDYCAQMRARKMTTFASANGVFFRVRDEARDAFHAYEQRRDDTIRAVVATLDVALDEIRDQVNVNHMMEEGSNLIFGPYCCLSRILDNIYGERVRTRAQWDVIHARENARRVIGSGNAHTSFYR